MEGQAWIAVAIGLLLLALAIGYAMTKARRSRDEKARQQSATREIYRREGE
jgi:hypothetical protein